MQALDTLSGENDTLKKENTQLVSLATAKGVSWQCRPCCIHLLLMLCLHPCRHCTNACKA
jgi:hypothetical protein